MKVLGLEGDEPALVGETVRVLSGRASADTEAQAFRTALEGHLFQLSAVGFSESKDVKPW